MPTNCQTEISEIVSSAVDSWPSQGANKLPRPTAFKSALGDAPERVEDELPDEADDDDRQHRRQEDQRAVDAAAAEPRQAEQHGEHQPDASSAPPCGWRRRSGCCASAFQNWPDQLRIGQQCVEIVEADEAAGARLVAGIEAEADRVDQRVDREERCRSQAPARETPTMWTGKRERDARIALRPLHARGREIASWLSLTRRKRTRGAGCSWRRGPPRS